MSNLGTYQSITRLSKAVGGPKMFIGMILGAGAAIGSITTAYIIKKVSNNKTDIDEAKKAVTSIDKKHIFETMVADKSNEEIIFNVGDKFRILEIDDDAVLIDKVGDKNSPYYVAKDFLEKISNFKKGEK